MACATIPPSTRPAASGSSSAVPTGKEAAEKLPSSTARQKRTQAASRAAPDAPLGKIPLQAAPWWRQPLGVAWMLTGLLAVSAFVVVYARYPNSPPAGEGETEPVADPQGAPVDAPVAAGDAPQDPRGGANDADRAELRSPAVPRLESLGGQLRDYVQEAGSFPPGTVTVPELAVDQRLSWQAILAARLSETSPPVDWNLPWNDRANEPFVRRRLPEFQNPAVPQLTGSDGYPATHFVGVAGFGADAAQLESGHPRAGIFGDDRRTRLADLRDGASQTWMVLGAQERIGSWGAGGFPTVRALTAPPFVSGPDGLGTGAADSMLVLLADGRVQSVSAAIEPRVVQALASLHDAEGPRSDDAEPELPLVTALEGTDPSSAELDPIDEEPLEPEFAPEPEPARVVDLAASLRQPILSFEQSRARPLVDLLPGLAEMVGAPIRYDPAELEGVKGGIRTSVQLKLQATTVGDILDGLFRPAGLTYRIEDDHLRVVPR
ncbi:MAG: DUF1559 domain-containing protein [Planctomycetales bacterium]